MCKSSLGLDQKKVNLPKYLVLFSIILSIILSTNLSVYAVQTESNRATQNVLNVPNF